MSLTQSVFPMISVRNPWGFLIQNGFKTIENRKKTLGKEFQNTWIALHVSKTFKSTEEKYAHKYLQNHHELLDSNHLSSKQEQFTKFFGSLKFNDRQKLSNLINAQLKPQMSNIIALIQISKCVSSFEGKSIDPLYCDEPFTADSHWVIADVIPLQSKEYCTTRGHMGCARITDTALNQLLCNILKGKLQERERNKENKENTKAQPEADDDEMMDILARLENDTDTHTEAPIAKQSGHKRKHEERTRTQTSNHPSKKRKLPTFITGASSPKIQRLSRNNSHVDPFHKLSRNNSLYDVKHNKIDLMISPETIADCDDIAECDIETELNAIIMQEEKEKEKEKERAMQQRLYSNPNELRRKQHVGLPDEYKWRVIVFDTETASFKPLGAIIDIGAVELINGKLTGRKFQSYIKPWAKIHPKAVQVHGITEHFLERYADGDIYEIIQSFMEWIHSDCICVQCTNLKPHESDRKHKLKLIGHNVTFDIRHLNAAIAYCQSKLDDGMKIWKPIDIESTFDTLLYFRNVLGNHGNYSLDGMCYKFGIKTDERKHAHGALVDAMVTAKCLQQMWKSDKDVKDRKCSNRFFTKKL